MQQVTLLSGDKLTSTTSLRPEVTSPAGKQTSHRIRNEKGRGLDR